MMALTFDTGVRTYDLNGFPFRFNPTDPNVHHRLMAAADMIRRMETECRQKARAVSGDRAGIAAESLKIMADADKMAKDILSDCFPGNDFHGIFEGVNIIALRADGKRAINGFFETIQPIVVDGMRALLRADQIAVEKYAGSYE